MLYPTDQNERSDLARAQREGRWVLPDMAGKGGRTRTVTIPAGVKSRIDAWLHAAGITEGRLFRPVTKAGVLAGEEIRDEKAVSRLVVRYSKAAGFGKLAPHRPSPYLR